MKTYRIVSVRTTQDIFEVEAESEEQARELWDEHDPYDLRSADSPIEQIAEDEQIDSDLLFFPAEDGPPEPREIAVVSALKTCLEQMEQAAKMFAEDPEWRAAIEGARKALAKF